jgi:hypothetical protein
MSLMGGGKAGPEAPRLQLRKAVAQRAIELVELCHPDGPLSKLAGRGQLERVSRGVYRVPFLPGRYGKASRSLRSAKRR